MISGPREQYNKSVTDKRYSEFISDLEDYAGEKIPFRIAETPVFVPAALKEKLIAACNGIITVIKQPAYLSLSQRAIPPLLNVPGEEGHAMWLAFDFAICR